MEDIVKDLLNLIELLPKLDQFKEMTDDEIRKLAIDLLKIQAEQDTGNAISNAITFIDYNNQ